MHALHYVITVATVYVVFHTEGPREVSEMINFMHITV